MKPVKVTQNPNTPVVPVEIIAASIKAISEGMKKLRSGPLNDRALYLLIQHAAPNVNGGRWSKSALTVKQIKAVFEGIESLEREYLKKPKAA